MAIVIKKRRNRFYVYHAYRDQYGKVRTDYMYPVTSDGKYIAPEHGGGKQ